RVVNIFDKHQFRSLHRTLDGHMKSIVEKGNKNRLLRRVWIWLSLLCCLRGGDAKRLKASWIKELDNGEMQLELPKEKNHAGGVKDPYAEAGISFIPSDSLENAYTPVADIKRYLLRRPNNVEDDYFFVSINVPKKEAKLDFKSRNITNHSMRST
ncbi:11804_t:CDS:2, partial [Dentiscutata erythropus]